MLENWRTAPHKRLTLIGMSGLGKTHISNILRADGTWYHYSVDYRIGTRYMGERIVDEFKRRAITADPVLREMLLSNSIYIGSNISFDNLAPLSHYLGKPGDPARGGIPFDTYLARQEAHLHAEQAATLDALHFMDRAEDIYGYPHFVCDTSGSICEVVDPGNPDDPILKQLAASSLIVWLSGAEDHIETLAERFDRAPKPMFTRRAVLIERWHSYLAETGQTPDQVDPDSFTRWSYRKILTERLPRYRAIAEGWGVEVPASAFAPAHTASDILAVIDAHLP